MPAIAAAARSSRNERARYPTASGSTAIEAIANTLTAPVFDNVPNVNPRISGDRPRHAGTVEQELLMPQHEAREPAVDAAVQDEV